jgi:acyl-CoA thioester hydrolase
MYKLPVQIRFSDVDGVGHINNVVYGDYFDIGRMCYFKEAFGENIRWGEGKTLVLVRTEADFRQPTFLYDTIEVHTSVTEIGARSVKMAQRIVAADGSVRVESRSVMSTYDMDTHRSFPLPDEWRAKLEAFEQRSRA